MPVVVVSILLMVSGWAAVQPLVVPIDVADSGHILVPVRFENGVERKLLLDTGSAGTVLDLAFAQQLGLPLHKAGEMEGAGTGTVAVQMTPHLALQLPTTSGAFAFRDENVVAIPLKETLQPLDPQLVGIIGGSFLKQNVITLNKRAHRMVITPAKTFAPPPGRLGLPMQIVGGFPVLPGSFVPLKRGEKQQRIEGNLLLDLGANHGLAIHWPTVARYSLIDQDDPAQRTMKGGMGITGATAPNRIAPCAEIRIGPLTRTDAEIELATGPGGAPPIPKLVGFVGTELFEGELILDYPGQKLWVASR